MRYTIELHHASSAEQRQAALLLVQLLLRQALFVFTWILLLTHCYGTLGHLRLLFAHCSMSLPRNYSVPRLTICMFRM